VILSEHFMNFRNDLAIIIPALNEEETIASVVSGVGKYGAVIVVDDGSTDDTGRIASENGAIVVGHEINMGYDQSLATGLQYAADRNYEFAITLDADGQHRANLIDSILNAFLSGHDLVVGCRDKRQRFSEVVFACYAALVWKVSDPLCGIKGYKISSLRMVQPLRTYDSVGTELAILASRSGWKIAQFPIITTARVGASRFGTGIRANWKILKALGNGIFRVRRVVL
jgi:glycosyltransferase involved in cell wall biosynthesis